MGNLQNVLVNGKASKYLEIQLGHNIGNDISVLQLCTIMNRIRRSNLKPQKFPIFFQDPYFSSILSV